MRKLRVLGAILFLGAPLLTVACVLFRDELHQLRLTPGREWMFERPALLPLVPMAVFVTGAVLWFPVLRKSRALAFLVGLLGSIPAFHLAVILLYHGGLNHRVVRFPDPGPFAEAVALTRGKVGLTCDLYVRRDAGEPMKHWGDLYLPCAWPFEVHRSPGRARYLLVDSQRMALGVVDLDDRDSVEAPGQLDLDRLQEEFSVRLASIFDPEPLRVMSFNIRYDNPGDGDNRWELRRDLVVATIEAFDPDLLGLQEVLVHQGSFLRERLEGYGFVGVGRDDGETKGEFAPLMYREKRFELLESGHFWLSGTPDAVGSRGWDAACTRMATWVRLRDRQAGHPILVLNTHWDHRGEQSRLESAKLVRSFVMARDEPYVITGDFNAAFRSEPYKLLRGGLKDTYRNAHKESGEEGGTFHGFDGNATDARIDWILCSKSFRVRDAAIDRTQRDGRYPSDHFPVTAVIE